MSEPKPVLTEEEIVACLDGFALGIENARRIEAAVLAKRDAQWKEMASRHCNCDVYDPEELCRPCRTVARMEER